MKKIFIPLLVFFVLTQTSFAQSTNAGWEKWQYMMGEWQGEGSGQPGEATGMFTLKPKLDGNILERKGRTSIAATNTHPAFLHEDVMIIYKNRDGNPSKAIYFDNESHVIQYDITYDDHKILLVSENIPGMPRFRLIYEKLDEKGLNIRFEMAMPNAPNDFKLYLEGKNKKVKELAEMPK